MLLRHTFKSLREKRLRFVLALTISAIPFSATAQNEPGANQSPWQESLAPAAKGTRIAVPKPILRELKADPENCLDPSPSELGKMDGYLILGKKYRLVAVWGRSSCFCSPTGNCAFWLFRPKMENTRKFSTPTWSIDSASRIRLLLACRISYCCHMDRRSIRAELCGSLTVYRINRFALGSEQADEKRRTATG